MSERFVFQPIGGWPRGDQRRGPAFEDQAAAVTWAREIDLDGIGGSRWVVAIPVVPRGAEPERESARVVWSDEAA